MKNLSLKSAKRAFTLVEIMIVVLIIGILLAIAIPNFIKAREQSRAKSCSENLKQIDAAKQLYAMDSGIKDGGAVTLSALIGPSSYIKASPLCPSTNTDTYTAAIGTINVNPSCANNTTTYPHTVNGLP